MPAQEQPQEKRPETVSKAPAYGVKEYLERAANFYYKKDDPHGEAPYLVLLQDINNHANRGEDWKRDDYLIARVEQFITDRLGGFIKKKKEEGNEQAAAYYRERLKILLDDLHRAE